MKRLLALTAAFSTCLTAPAVGLTNAERQQLSMTGWPRFDNPEFLTAYRSAIAGDLNTAKINFDRAVRANRSQCQREVALAGSEAARVVLAKQKFYKFGKELLPGMFRQWFSSEMTVYSSLGYSIPDSCSD